jgi:hypothetical protein
VITVGVFALVAKALLAVMLLVAGGAKVADRASFAATVRLFLPLRISWLAFRSIALGIALVELALGIASMSWPAIGLFNLLVFVLACGFLVVSGIGYVFHRGRSCMCFGALSRRKFDAAGVVRSIAIVALAVISMSRVRPTLVSVNPTMVILVFLAALVVALAAFTAAKSLAIARRFDPEMR